MGSRLIAFLLLHAAVIAFGGASAWAQSCGNPQQRPEITLTVSEGDVTYDQTRTTAQIAQLAAQRGGVKHAGIGNILGLTVGDLGIRTEAQFSTQQVTANRYCIWIVDVKVNVGYDKMTVYIDKKYRPGSCAYNRILEHENEHVVINRRVLTSFTQEIADTLEQAVLELNPRITHTPDTTQKALFKAVQERLQPVYNAYRAKLAQEQEPLDTPENYRRVQAKCGDW